MRFEERMLQQFYHLRAAAIWTIDSTNWAELKAMDANCCQIITELENKKDELDLDFHTRIRLDKLMLKYQKLLRLAAKSNPSPLNKDTVFFKYCCTFSKNIQVH